MKYELLYKLKKDLETQFKERGEKVVFHGCIRKEDDLYEWISFDFEIPGKDIHDYPLISNVFKIEKQTGKVLQVYKTDILYEFSPFVSEKENYVLMTWDKVKKENVVDKLFVEIRPCHKFCVNGKV